MTTPDQTSAELKALRQRLKDGKLESADISFLDALVSKAEADGLGQLIGGKRVVARLPNGMDIIK